MKPVVVEGDLLEQRVDVIVNPWNRNIILWWLLLPQGISGATKQRAGTGGLGEEGTLALMLQALEPLQSDVAVTIVRFRR